MKKIVCFSSLRSSFYKTTHLFLEGIICGTICVACIAPVGAVPKDSSEGTHDLESGSAPITTLKSNSLVNEDWPVSTMVIESGIPSIERELEPIWDWSRQRIGELTERYSGTDLKEAPVLSITQAEQNALANDHTLKQSKYSIEAVHHTVGQAQATWYPTIRLSGNMNANGSLNSSSGGTFVDTSSGSSGLVKVSVNNGVKTNLGVSLTIAQTLYDYSTRRKLRRAELNEIASLADYESKRLDVILEVRKAWFTAFADQISLDVLREAVENKKMRLKQAQGLYIGGTKARIDVATAESDVAQAELEVMKQEAQLAVDWVNLNLAMGNPSKSPYRLVMDPYWDRGTELTDEQMTDIALAHRPELLNLQAKLRAQLCTIELADSSKYPTVTASADVSESGSMTPFDGTWSVGVRLNWNLFDGFLQKYEKLEATATAKGLAEQFEQERLTIYSDVMSKILVMRKAAAAIPSAEVAVAKAKESYRLASARYRVGVGDSVEVSDAEISLSQAQLSFVTAASTYREAKAELIRAIGVDNLDDLPLGGTPIKLDDIPDYLEGER